LREPNFAADIVAIVERHGLSPHRFELELTEGILVNNRPSPSASSRC
jgi:EAL domain-containing protein (putative c-di-GMP-specific phosphodiesterase class I)